MKELKKKTKTTRNKIFIIATVLTLTSNILFASTTVSNYRIIFYNVENLFDTFDDPEKNDNEFLPDGDRFWNSRKYNLKLKRIFQVIMASSQGTQPCLIGLCEVENRTVLEDLLHWTPLGKMGYKIIHKESPDRRGIDVALLYNANLFSPISYNAIPVAKPNDDSFITRDILHVSGKIESDTLHVFVNHWPSKYGGILETKPLRAIAANTLKEQFDSLFSINSRTKVIAMGDFNDSPFDESVVNYLGAIPIKDTTNLPQIINLSYGLAQKGMGTNKYQGKWALIDQIFVSSGLLKSSSLQTNEASFNIFEDDFLLEDDKNFLGKKPFRTYLGFKYHNGFSDHLPVTLDLKSTN